MSYTSIIKDFFKENPVKNVDNIFYDLYYLVKYMKSKGFSDKNVDESIIQSITDGFLGSNTSKIYTIKFNTYITYYLKYFLDIIKNDGQIKVKEEPVKEKVKEDVYKLKPEDFKEKEYDEELLKLIDADKEV